MDDYTKIMNLIIEIFNRVSDETKARFIDSLIDEFRKTGNEEFLNIKDKLEEQNQAEKFQLEFNPSDFYIMDF